VSRTPVREAVKRLSDEHLIDVVAQSATRAARIDAKEIEESFLIRRALEMESAAQAAAHMSQDHADKLHDILMMHARAVERKHFIEAIARDDEFHRYISEISDLPRLWSTIEISKAQLDRCRHLMLPRAGEAERTLEQHREVIRALNSRDPAKASAAMKAHLDAAYRSTVAVLEGPGLG
jgi:DNA-binding GntR family transcriptional regulator